MRGDGEHDRYETCRGKDDYYVLCTADCRVAAGRRGTEIMRSQKIFEKACELMPGVSTVLLEPIEQLG